MSELGAAAIATALQARYEIRGEAPVHGMATELFPFIGASDELMDPELHFPGSRLCAAASVVNPDVALGSICHLTNNPETQTVGVVEKIELVTDTANELVFLCVEGGPLTVIAGVPGFTRDSRWGWQTARTVLTSQGENLPLGLPGQIIVRMAGGPTPFEMVTWTGRLVLYPQSRVIVRSSIVNAFLQVNWYWRERGVQSAELRNAR